MFPMVYRSYRKALVAGLTPEVLDAAALGVVAALRRAAPAVPPAPSAATSPSGVSAWAHEGRTRLQANRRWVDANHARRGR
jgi:hypothetical protein